ncbi:MAG: hypothetical protein M0R37_07770 [Bacteroidales bacterium]|nr:hypothetical protein [Bacteroidales bacterium]
MTPLKPKTCPRCGVSLPWEIDTTYLSEFALYLSHRHLLFSGKDTHDFYADPQGWLKNLLYDGDLRAQFEAERRVAA